jgi:hypothetical protein
MKLSVLLSAVLVAVVVLIFYGTQPRVSRLNGPAPAVELTSPTSISTADKAPEKTAENEPGPSTATPTPAVAVDAGQADQSSQTPAAHRAYVEKRTAELQDLSAENDAASLAVILSELSNRDREIRKAAIEASIQFGSRDAIPKLREAAAQTDDAAEKAEFQAAADYLELPSLTEYLAQQKANGTPIKAPAPRAPNNFPKKKAVPTATPQ